MIGGYRTFVAALAAGHVHGRVCACVCVCACVRVRVCVRACVCVCAVTLKNLMKVLEQDAIANPSEVRL